jgi:hemoglobin-like flavoprotein
MMNKLTERMKKTDVVELTAVALFAIGTVMMVGGMVLSPSADLSDVVGDHYPEWIGVYADAAILWIINWVIKRDGKQRVLSQLGSLSNDFALDAAKTCRDKGWLTDGSLRSGNLAEANLSGANLRDAGFAFASLDYARLDGSNMCAADLREASLVGADLRGCELRWADLTNAKLRWAKLEGASLAGAKLTGADLRFVDLSDVDTEGVDLTVAQTGGVPDQATVDVIQRSFKMLRGSPQQVGERFYGLLFEADPSLRRLFVKDMKQQHVKLIQTLALVVEGLKQPEKVVPIAKSLGARHARYGVEPEHYETVGATLHRLLEDQIGDEYTPEVRDAWNAAYTLLATAMIDASKADETTTSRG